MKNLSAIIVTMLVLCTLQACNHAGKNYNKTADSDTTVQDTSTTINLSVDKDDSVFAVEAINGGLTEVALGKLAIQQGKSKKVKNFGVMMVKDHGKVDDKLMALAKDKNISLPTAPDTAGQKIIAGLAKRSGADFDKAYINCMIDDHQKAVKLFDDESKKIQDPDLKAFAEKTLPVLQKHLDAINAIHDSMPQ